MCIVGCRQSIIISAGNNTIQYRQKQSKAKTKEDARRPDRYSQKEQNSSVRRQPFRCHSYSPPALARKGARRPDRFSQKGQNSSVHRQSSTRPLPAVRLNRVPISERRSKRSRYLVTTKQNLHLTGTLTLPQEQSILI